MEYDVTKNYDLLRVNAVAEGIQEQSTTPIEQRLESHLNYIRDISAKYDSYGSKDLQELERELNASAIRNGFVPVDSLDEL